MDKNQDTQEHENIEAMPTFRFYKNGKMVDELVGANEKELEEKIIKNMT